jgi:mono/diheme cytochrome c family protein
MSSIKYLLGFCFAFLTFSVLPAAAQEPVFLDQGPAWTAATRGDFYTRDQGSRMIPLAWLQALKQANGQPFLADSLARYGYLPNPAENNGLPIGFNASGPNGVQVVGMVCAACHTRQITTEGRSYRVDGGPALADFQGLLTDLDTAVGQILASDAAFKPFAATVLRSPNPDPADIATLRGDVDGWYLRFHTLMTRALPSPAWGLGRLDAVGMIFNRIAGLDVGPPPSFLIPDNIKKADAPVRYPFLWNAAIQDKTEWPGFLDNGSDILGLGRNLGEVLGVFARFEPKREGLLINFLNNHSMNFDGLAKLEDLIRKIAPPKYPWPIDVTLAAQGQEIFARASAAGGCQQCHGITRGVTRFPFSQTWATPLLNVGTDTREYDILGWRAKTGVLQGVFIPFVTEPLKETDLVLNMVATSVIGSIAEYTLGGGGSTANALVATAQSSPSATASASSLGLRALPPELKDLARAFNTPAAKGAYESRVLQGIWAAAPYLHNGSVATLADLLKPVGERAASFKMGPAYDIENLGIAAQQPQSGYTMTTTDCSDLNSGNSRCGHEYGTQLTGAEKKALLEYLKTL